MERENFPLQLAPSLIRDFVSAYQLTTEAPDEFLATTAMFVGSVLAGRWVEFNGQFLNNFYLIVGPTGTSKKTTAQSLSLKLLRAIQLLNPIQKYNHIKLSENEELPQGPDTAYPIVTHFSIEGLQSHSISEGTSTAIQMGEYGTLFAIEKRQSQQNTISELTNMYDGNIISVKTLSRSVAIENYAISIFGASTAGWIEGFCSGKNISGGFVNRHIVITGRPLRILPKPIQPSPEVLSDIVSRFANLIPISLVPIIEEKRIKWRGKKLSLAWTSETEAAWSRYYFKRVEEMRRITDQRLTELSARELTHATKLMGISTFLDGRLTVGLKDLEFGIRFSRWSTQNTIAMMAPAYLPKSEAGRRVFEKLTKSGPISKTDLAKALGGKQHEINRAILHMIADEVLEECPDGLLRFQQRTSNSQQSETEKFFGKLNSCELFQKSKLDVETSADLQPQDLTEFEERAAIMEHDGGLSKEKAELSAQKVLATKQGALL
jgi:hypothetical protein